MPTSGSRDGNATRERLIDAAFELYTTTGFLRTTTPILAGRAGVAEGTIYRHFASKEHLLNEAYRRSQRWGLGLLQAHEGDRGRRAAERLALLGREIVEAAATTPAQVRMFFSEAYEPFLDELSRATRKEFLEALVQLIAMGKSDGMIRPGPAELWAQVWFTLVGMAAERVAAGEWTMESGPLGLTLEAAWDAIAMKPQPGDAASGEAPLAVGR